jgi:PEP-CTERM motif-containing protein
MRSFTIGALLLLAIFAAPGLALANAPEVVTVPEPATALLLTAGSLGALLLARSRRK